MNHPSFETLVAPRPPPEVVGHILSCVRCRRWWEAWFQTEVLPDRTVRTRSGADDGRFEVTGELGRGGMGNVLRAFDTLLAREVALKILRSDRTEPEVAERLVGEAKLTARLQHPSISPIYALGWLEDGRPFYATRVVHGKTLRELVHDNQTDPMALRTAIDLLRRTAEVVAYAHEEEVHHGDVKPENVLVGRFGELVLIDFGLSVVGTVGYLPPESGAGAPLAGPRDVFALGVMLYEFMIGDPPYRGDADACFAAAALGPPLMRGDLPPDLRDLCAEALSPDPAVRPTAAVFARRLEAWLAGAQRLDEARRVAGDAVDLAGIAQSIRRDAEARREQSERWLSELDPLAPAERKAPAWQEQATAARMDLEADALEARVEQQLVTALGVWPGLPEARLPLNDLRRSALLRSERQGDTAQAQRYEALLRQDGGLTDWLDAPVPLTLLTDRPGCAVRGYKLREHLRRLVPGPGIDLGTTPVSTALPPGSWKLELDGDPRLGIAVSVRRGEGDPMVDPDGVVTVHAVPTLGPDECWVPAGWTHLGGDEAAADVLPALRLWVPGFVMMRHPVTIAEYQTFLDDHVDSGRQSEADRYAPVVPTDAPRSWVRDGRRWRPPAGAGPDFPVVFVDHGSALAYAEWAAARDGLPWRLATEFEWEKAARGADARIWPWGNHFEPGWAHTVHAQDRPNAAAVGAFPADVSVYGVMGLVGGVRDWTASAWARRPAVSSGGLAPAGLTIGEDQVIRGGSYVNTHPLCRPTMRYGSPPSRRIGLVGVRLVRSLSPAGSTGRG